MGSRSWGILLLLAGALALLLVRMLEPTTARPQRARVPTEERIPDSRAAVLVPSSTGASPSSATPARDAREAVVQRSTLPSVPRASQVGQPELCVQLIDAWGAPVAGVSLALFALQRGEGERRPQSEALTDVGGRACFLATLVSQWAASTEVDLVRVVALLPLDERPALELDPRFSVPAELVLTLPPLGALVVHVLDPQGQPAERASVEAIFKRPGHPERHASAEVAAGLARFPAVELGTRIELRTSTPDLRARGTRLELDGPRAPGETVETTLRFDFEWPVLAMRVLDESGRPLARTSLGLRVLHGRLSPQPGQAVTEDDGTLRFVVYGQPRSEDLRELLLWTQRPPRFARLTLPGELGWPTDLGDVILRPNTSGNVPP